MHIDKYISLHKYISRQLVWLVSFCCIASVLSGNVFRSSGRQQIVDLHGMQAICEEWKILMFREGHRAPLEKEQILDIRGICKFQEHSKVWASG